MTSATIKPLEEIVDTTQEVAKNLTNPEKAKDIYKDRAHNPCISVLYIYFSPEFEKAEQLIKILAKQFRSTDTIFYSQNCAGILLVGCGSQNIKSVHTRIKNKLPNLIKKTLEQFPQTELSTELYEFALSYNTYQNGHTETLEEFINEVKKRIIGENQR